MTQGTKDDIESTARQRPSLLPFDPAGLTAMRVLPAEFARMVGVSKQAVSQWIKRGVITPPGPDGRIDPKIAAREVIANTDPARLRARVFKHATASLDELRQRVRDLEAELASERDYGDRREQAAKFRAEDAAGQRLGRVIEAINRRWHEAIEARTTGHWERWTDELIAVEFYGLTLAEFREYYEESEPTETHAAAINS